ncbi:MCE family protein [Nocardioides sp. WL0053]|uniref:MCE family protein n=1 Tax=Nocardioides jiangsuensis TaxID=2866161 RepID=A0ABS7RI67_9ACTN|nr:MCE family protein [Nocardioides jiangsuensis]MBY9074731.1 MCE family protein [Nocardioides jiangsuensis]
MSVPFRERNPVIVGAVSLAVITAMIMAAFRAEDLPLIGGGDTYYAAFSEAGGLKANDEVRVAGVRVGKVQSVDLDGDHVRVEFTVERGVDFGAETAANIKVKTLLGAMYLALDPAGSGQLEEGAEIPRERTTSPYDVVDAFEGLASTSERIDTDRLATSLDTLSTLMQDTPEEFRGALRGMSALSQNIAARDAQLNELLGNMQKVSKVLADRNGDLVTLMEDGDKLFRALVARREAVHNLLVATSQLSRELTLLVRQTRADLKPALDNLDSVVDMLNRNQENLDNSLRLMAPFYRVFANTLGTGPWFDTYIQNLPPVPQIGGN